MSELAITPEQAREIMGENFFGIEKTIKHFGITPSNQQIAALAEVPATEKILESCRNTHLLVAVLPISILDVRNADNKLLYFYSHMHIGNKWYESKRFANDKGVTGWQLVRKTPVEGSTSKNWSEQEDLLSKDEKTPSSQVMVYTIIGHYKNTGERLFENVNVRTSCMNSDHHVYVGGFDSSGLSVGEYWNGIRFSNLGASSARKLTHSTE